MEFPQCFMNLKEDGWVVSCFQMIFQECSPLQDSGGLALRDQEAHSAVVQPHLTVLRGILVQAPLTAWGGPIPDVRK